MFVPHGRSVRMVLNIAAVRQRAAASDLANRESSLKPYRNRNSSLTLRMVNLNAGIRLLLQVEAKRYQRLTSAAITSKCDSGILSTDSTIVSTHSDRAGKVVTIASETLDNIDRNGWSTSIGIGGQHRSEYALPPHREPRRCRVRRQGGDVPVVRR